MKRALEQKLLRESPLDALSVLDSTIFISRMKLSRMNLLDSYKYQIFSKFLIGSYFHFLSLFLHYLFIVILFLASFSEENSLSDIAAPAFPRVDDERRRD